MKTANLREVPSNLASFPRLPKPHQEKSKCQVVSITSGKGGVGKTLTTVNLAVAARRMGLSVLIFDGDLGLANVDVVLGLQSRYNIRDVLDNQVKLRDIIVEGPLGIQVIPSGSGISRLTQLTYVQKVQLLSESESLQDNVDLILIDTGAGISESVMHFNAVAQSVVVVTTPEPHAMTDAYALIKVLHEEYGEKTVHLLVNQTRSADEGLKIYNRLADVAKQFLNIPLQYIGSVPHDQHVQRSVMLRKAASEESTYTVAGQAWNQMARQLFQKQETDHATTTGDVASFWRALVDRQPLVRQGSWMNTK